MHVGPEHAARGARRTFHPILAGMVLGLLIVVGLLASNVPQPWLTETLGIGSMSNAPNRANQSSPALGSVRAEVGEIAPASSITPAAIDARGVDAMARARAQFARWLAHVSEPWGLLPVLLGLALACPLVLLPFGLKAGSPVLWRRLPWARGCDGIVPLRQAGGRSDVGTEAVRFASMLEAGFPVLQGVVLTPDFISRWQAATDEDKARLVRTIVRAAGAGPYVVRGAGRASTALRDRSISGVAGDELGAAIDEVFASLDNDRARQHPVGTAKEAVIVQRMVAGVYGGVLVTQAPDAPGLMLLEMTDEGPFDVVSGRVTPKSYRFGRRTGQPVETADCPFDPSPLIAFGRGLEERFGGPQYIEWAWDGRKLWLVQCRDVGAELTSSAPSIVREWDRALMLADDGSAGTGETLARNARCKALPQPTPATLSLIERLHAHGSSVDLACRELGLRYNVTEEAPALFPTVFGQLYCNVAEARRRQPKLTRRDRWRIRRRGPALARRVRDDVLPRLKLRLRSAAMSDFDALPTSEHVRVIGEIVERLVVRTHVEADVVSIAAEVIVSEARQALWSGGHDPADWLAPQGEPRHEGPVALSSILEHRNLLDYALAVPRVVEDISLLRARQVLPKGRAPVVKPDESGSDSALPRRIAKLVANARLLQRLRNDVRLAVKGELALLRKALLALDRRFGLRNGIFLLSLDEIMALSEADRERLRRLVSIREAERATIASAALLPDALSVASLEMASWSGRDPADYMGGRSGSWCFGTRVAGLRRAGGRACVVDEAAAAAGAPLSELMPGDVLVAPFVHEAWLGEVLKASGVILGGGGWLSHTATIARERNIALIVGVSRLADIPDGSHVTLELDGSIRVEGPTARSIAAQPALAQAGRIAFVEVRQT